MTTTSERVAATARPNAVHQPAEHSSRRWWALVVIALAQLMVVLDMTIVNIALPHMQQDLHLTTANRQWVITAYTLAFGGLLLVGGRISDLIGRKVTFLIGLAGFGAASALGGAAMTAGLLFGARALQGLFAALLAPSALSLMSTTFSDPKERGKAFGVYSAVAGGGGAIGLIAGGILTEKLDWRWCMYVNVPIAIIAVIGGALLVHGQPSEHPDRKLDIPGVILGCGGLLAVVYGMAEAGNDGWASPLVLILLIGGVVLLALFALVESKSKRPLLPPHVLADRNRAGSFIAVLLVVIGMFGLFLFFTYFLQFNLHYSPIKTGFAFLPLTLSIVTASTQISARLMPYVPPRWLITPGAVLAAAGLLVMSQLTVHSGYVQIVLPTEILFGLGMGLGMMPSMNTATLGVPPRDAGVTSATVNTAQQVGGTVGTALLNTISATATAGYLATHAHTALESARATVHGYDVADLWALGLMLVAALAAGLMINANPQRMRRAATRTADSDLRDVTQAVETELLGADVRTPDGAVRGRVTDAGGEGVPGAVLTLISPRGLQIAQTTAAEDGTYRLETPGTGNYILAVSTKSYKPKAAWITLSPAGLDFNVSLDGGARLTGTVRVTDTGQPVTDAVVTLVNSEGAVAGSTTTDNQGRYRFSAPSAGQYTLTVSHTEHQPAAVPTTIAAEGSATQDVGLKASVELSGTIRDPRSGPVDGAKVTLMDAQGAIVGTTITDGSGHYRFAGVRPGDYTLVAAGYAPVAQPLALAGEQHRRDIEFVHHDPSTD